MIFLGRGCGLLSSSETKTIFRMLKGREPLQRLAPERVWDEGLSAGILALALPLTVEGEALRSALLLWNDDLDRSHTLSQELHTTTGSLLHGIMHRMEGDYSNAEYWLRRAGAAHPSYEDVARAAAGIEGAASYMVNDAWDPYRYNHAVERAVHQGVNLDLLERIQHAEMAAVTAYCFKQCFGGTVID
jgi:hypothetical protein